MQITKQNWFTISSTSIDSFVECMNHLQNASEEMADALHFFIELLIYTNIQPEDINSYIESKLPKNKRQNFSNTLEYGMALGKQWLTNMNQVPDVKKKNLVNLIHKYEQVKVDKEFRRMGVASGMYAFVEKESGKTLQPAKTQNELGKSIWENPNRPFGDL